MSTGELNSAADRIPTYSSLQRILVATDFSKQASEALEWAMQLAIEQSAELILVHAIDATLPWLAEQGGPLEKIVRENLEALRKIVAAKKILVRTECAIGRPWFVVSQFAEESKANLIVVGAHASSTVMQRVMGATANRLIQVTSIPVVAYRKRLKPNAQGIQTILASTDFSQESARAIGYAISYFWQANVQQRLVLLHSLPIPLLYIDINIPIPSPEFWGETEASAREHLKLFATQLRREGLEIDTKVARDSPVDAVLREAEAVGADLIAIGTVGRTGINRFLLGSIAEQILHYAPCPVLTVQREAAQTSGLRSVV